MAAPPSPTSRPRFLIGGDPRALERELLREIDAPAATAAAPRTQHLPIERTFVVAPTKRLLDHVTGELTRARGALAGIHFFHHESLATHLLAQANAAEPATMSSPLLEVLLLDRVRSLDVGLARYVARQPAAIGALLATLNDLRDAGVDASAARRAPLSPRGVELVAVLATFEALLAELGADGAGDGAGHARAATKAAAAMNAGPSARPAPCARLIHYGAYELIGVHRELLQELARRVPTTFLVAAPRADGPPQELADAFSAKFVEVPGAPATRRNHLLSAAGPREEMRLALRTLLGWHVNDGVAFEAMAILAHGPRSHLRALRSEAALLEVVPDTSFKTPLSFTPLAQKLRLVLDGAPGYDGAAEREVARAFRRAVPPAERVAGLANWAREQENNSLATELAKALDAAARELARVPTSRRPLAEAAALSHYLERLLDEEPLKPAEETSGGLRVLDLHQARALPFERAVLVGANDRLLPRRAGEDFFLGDADRRALRDATGAPVPLRSALRRDDELLFDSVCAAVKDELVVTFARADADDRDASPSLFLRRLGLDPERPERLIPRGPREECAALLERTRLLTPQEALMQAAAQAPRERRELLRFGSARGFDPEALEAGLARIAAIDDSDGGDLRFDGAAIAVRAKASFSPTEIGQLGRCPLQYFFASELGIAVPDELVDGELSPRELGSLLHRTLESLYRELLSPGQPIRAGELTPAARARLPEHFARAAARIARASLPPPRLWAVRSAELVADLADFVAADLRRMEQLGLRAGEFETPQKVDLDVAGRRVPLSFRIDRILVDAEGREWIGDYKLSAIARLEEQVRPKEAVRALALQLPLYRLAREAQGRKVAGLEFLSLRRPRRRDGEPFVPMALDQLAPHDAAVTASLAVLLGTRESGSFPLVSNPGDSQSQCSRCDFRRACRHSHAPTVARVGAAGSNGAFYSLAGQQLAKRPAG